MAVDGRDADEIRETLSGELTFMSSRHETGASMFDTMNKYCPAFGMIGTLVGLIAMLGNMGDNGLPDQITGIRQLAERYGWIDINRVGIFGHSGGGYAAADAILRHPEFYDVAVSQAGNHDNRNYEDDWGEKWEGLLVENPDGSTNYDNQANQLLAENLVGKLLIAHGTTDTNVPLSNTMLLVDALIDANKDFDLLLLPNREHGFGNEPYMMRQRWDYFVRHLLQAEPPADYEIGHLQRPMS